MEKKVSAQAQKTKNPNAVSAMAAGPEVPTGDDFFDLPTSMPSGANFQMSHDSVSGTSQKQFYIQKVHRQAPKARQDPRVFDQTLVGRALAVIEELSKTHSFAIITT